MKRPPYITNWHWKYADKEWDSVTMYGYFPVSVYKDSTMQYTDAECDEDNCVEIPVPEDLLWQWWCEGLEFDRSQPESKQYEPEDGWDEPTRDDLVRWVYEESTCDDTIDLLEWLEDHGYYWKRLD